MSELNSTTNKTRDTQLAAIAIAPVAAIITIKAVSVMMFASLGASSTGKLSYVLVLQIVLATIGICGYLSISVNLNSNLSQPTFTLSSTLGGVLLGFYYGGSYTDNNLQYAVLGAIASGMLFCLGAVFRPSLMRTATAFISSICAYGFALMAGIRGINLIAAAQLTLGVVWLAVSLIYIALTVSNAIAGIAKIEEIVST